MNTNFITALLAAAIGIVGVRGDSAQVAQTQWARRAGGSTTDYSYASATDTLGNCYVTGRFSGTAQFGETNVTSSGDDDMFVAMHDGAGDVRWVRSAGGTGSDVGRAIAVDSAGNCYVTGQFENTASFGGTNLTSAGGYDVFIAKYDPAGVLQWTRQAGGLQSDLALSIAVDGSGNCYVTGGHQGTANFGGIILTNAGTGDLFIAKYTTAGVIQWARRAGAKFNFQIGRGIAADSAGNCFVTGQFQGTVDFGGTTLTSRDTDMFVARYSSAGALTWVRSGGSTDSDTGVGIALDADGNSYVTGDFRLTGTFGTATVTSAGASDIFVAKYNRDGTIQWARGGGGTAEDHGLTVAMDNAGNAYPIGSIGGNATFGTNVVNTTASEAFCLLKYAANGTLAALQKVGEPGARSFAGIAVNPLGEIFVTGPFLSTAGFGTTNLTSAGQADVFVAKLVLSNAPPTVAITDPANGAVFTEGNSISLAATASDPDGLVARVEFSRDGVVFRSVSSAPYTASVNGLITGTYVFAARAIDNFGLSSTMAAVSVRVNGRPNVTITSPTNGATFTVPGIIPLQAAAADADGTVVEVSYYAYGIYLGRSTNGSFSFDWRNVALGPYCVTAIATDNQGATRTSSQVCFTITNLPSQAPRYILTDLGTLGGPSSQARDINDLGVVTGYSETTNDYNHPFVFTNGVMKDLNTVRADGGFGLGINRAGRVAGYYSPSVGYDRASIWNGTNRTELGTLGGNNSFAEVINASGQVVGYSEINSSSATRHAFLYTNGVMRDLGTLGGVASYAYDINDSGQVAGYSGLTNIGSQAFIYDVTNGMRGLGTLGGLQCHGFAINNLGQVAGESIIPSGEYHAFLYRNGIMENLFRPYNTSSSQAQDLNDAGQVVGICDSGSSSPKAFLWQNSVIHLLTPTITNTDWELQSAQAINQRGQIVGYGRKGGVPERRAYLLTPDAPPTVSLASPANGAQFAFPTSVLLTASATDIESGIRKVEFFVNGSLVATDTSFPFGQVWSNVPIGTYALTAVATDNRDLVSTSAPVNITVVFVNLPPTFVAGPDQTVPEDSGPQTVAGWASAISPGATSEEGQTLTFLVTSDRPDLFASQPAIDPGGALTFTPAPDAFGSAALSVVLMDDAGRANGGLDTSETQSFLITVLPVNDTPIAHPQTLSLNEDASLGITLTGSDIDGDALSFAIVTRPAHGTLSGTAPNLVYTPASNYCGSDSLSFTVNDGQDASAARISITVICANDCPTVTGGSLAVEQESTASGQLSAVDLDGDPLRFLVTQPPAHGSVTVEAQTGAYTYSPSNGYCGPDGFNFRVSDGNCASDEANVTVDVRCLPPVLNCPTGLVVECTGGLTPASFSVMASNAMGPVPVTCVPPSGTGFRLGTSNVVCTATSGGSSVSCPFTVTVVDTTPPQVTCPGDITALATNASGAVVHYTSGAFDACDLADFSCSPPTGSVFPIGTTAATCTASDPSRNTNSCRFRVVVLGARGIKLDCLTNLVALRAGVTNRHDGEELDDAIEHLTRSLEPALWIDEIHLQRKGGDKVFEEEKKAVHELVELLKDKHGTVAGADLHALIDCILRADRMLAVKAVDDAVGVKPKKIAEDRKEIDKGDEDAVEGKYEEAIEHYRNAWKHAVHIKIEPPHRLATGGAHLTFIAIEQETYVIQASADLIHWVSIGTATANADGEVALEDPGASGQTSRFYRVVAP